jgi:hypothetical protein
LHGNPHWYIKQAVCRMVGSGPAQVWYLPQRRSLPPILNAALADLDPPTSSTATFGWWIWLLRVSKKVPVQWRTQKGMRRHQVTVTAIGACTR